MPKPRRLSDEVMSQENDELLVKLQSAKFELARLQKTNSRAHERIQELEQAIANTARLKEQAKIIKRPVASSNAKKGSAIAIVTWTDWHVAERVFSSKVGGLNKYNPDVAKQRAEKNTHSTIKLIRRAQRDSIVKHLVLVLGGDFVTGHLHPELAETNVLGPVEEQYYAQQLLLTEINTLVSQLDMQRIRVVCHRGNHGRTTKKMQFKNDYETNYESAIYWNLRDRIQGPEWVIPTGDVAHTELCKDCYLRTMHGHQIRYQGGVGGIAVPASRWIYRSDQTRKAVFNIFGHHHQYLPSSTFSISGSLKGYDEFSQSHGFAYQPPTQQFQLFDIRRKMITDRNPILCE